MESTCIKYEKGTQIFAGNPKRKRQFIKARNIIREKIKIYLKDRGCRYVFSIHGRRK
jgi:hypothetical protein